MDDDLIAIGHFFNSGEAHIARGLLASEGIDAEVADEFTSVMDWALTNAIHGVKILVRKSDAERAITLLEKSNPPGDVDTTHQDSEESADDLDDDAPPANPREQLAEHAWRAAKICLLCLPFELYAFWLLIRVYVADEPMRPEYRRRAWFAAMVTVPCVLFICLTVRAVLRL